MSVLVVGECLVDVVERPDGSVVEAAGGSPANVAVGLGRLGVPVSLVTSYGDDPRGRLLQDHLLASKVVPQVHLAPTSVARARLDQTGAATYSFDLRWELGELDAGTAKWLHVGSLGATLAPGAAVVRRLVAEVDCPVSYDPNCRPSLMGPDVREQVQELVALSDVVKLSAEDAEFLHPGLPHAELAARWLALGPTLVVVTLGADGADAWTPEGHLHVDVPDGAPVVDTVGAGDAFMSGLLWSLLEDGQDVRAALRTASQVARRTCERPGADPPWSL
jgi:fructokinase